MIVNISGVELNVNDHNSYFKLKVILVINHQLYYLLITHKNVEGLH